MELLVEQYQKPLLAFFYNCVRNMADAQDLTQDVFFKILRSKKHSKTEYEKRMVFAIAWNVLRDKYRRDKSSRREQHIPIDDVVEKEAPFSLERSLDSEQAYRHLLQRLNELSQPVKTALILRCFEGLSNKEIANHCCITVSGVEKRMKTALRHIKKVQATSAY